MLRNGIEGVWAFIGIKIDVFATKLKNVR